MKKMRVLSVAVAASAFLAGCGGSGTGDQSPNVAFDKMINFGDSLSDVGTYKTTLVASSGGGEYSINGNLAKAGFPHTNWTEYIAATLQLAAPCAEEVGLDSVGQLSFMAQTPADNTSCFDYAQGGARVTNPYGPGNNFYYENFGDPSGQLGQLTKPIVQQVTDYLSANANAFGASDLVTVLGGGNDVLIDRAVDVDAVVAQLIAEGLIGTDAGNQAIAAAAQQAIDDSTTAGTQLSAIVLNQIIGGGAKYVVMVNLPDLSQTPDAANWLANGAGQAVEPVHPHLTLDMVNAFNGALATGLGVTAGESSHAEIVWVDAFATNDDEIAQPNLYALTNVTAPACDLKKTGVTVPGAGLVPIASSLFCSVETLNTDTANVTPTDPSGVGHYLFADTVHPTPHGYSLLARLVSVRMADMGWL
jgi:phospholipase/lecithinase/hemolysin